MFTGKRISALIMRTEDAGSRIRTDELLRE